MAQPKRPRYPERGYREYCLKGMEILGEPPRLIVGLRLIAVIDAGSWESYLEDFITKAHAGQNAA